jgi:hypothetical protein
MRNTLINTYKTTQATKPDDPETQCTSILRFDVNGVC